MSMIGTMSRQEKENAVNLVSKYNELARESGLGSKYGKFDITPAEFDPNGNYTMPYITYEKDGMTDKLDFEAGIVKANKLYPEMAKEDNINKCAEECQYQVLATRILSKIEIETGRGTGRPCKTPDVELQRWGDFAVSVSIEFNDIEDACPATMVMSTVEDLEHGVSGREIATIDIKDARDRSQLTACLEALTKEAELQFDEYKIGMELPQLVEMFPDISEADEIDLKDLEQEITALDENPGMLEEDAIGI